MKNVVTGEREMIVRAAFRLGSGALFLGRRHCDCIAAAVKAGASKPVKKNLQGFLTSEGRFVDRYVAGAIAYHAGQTMFPYNGRGLTSVYLW